MSVVRGTRRILGYAGAWSPVALGYALALALGDHLPWPDALLAGTLSTLPAAVMGVGVIALCERLAWPRTARSRVPFVLVHALAALAYATLWAAAIITEMWSAAPASEVRAFLANGFAWQVVTGVITYAVLAGVAY